MRHLFAARSPQTGKIRQYEGLVELGTSGPYAIVSIDQGVNENYHPGDEGYKQLLEDYSRAYPEDE